MTEVEEWALVALGLIVTMALILLLPGDAPCSEWNGLRWVKIWPRPVHCQ